MRSRHTFADIASGTKALSIAHNTKLNDPAVRRILECTAGIVFMGTPHAGADIAFWASLAGKLLSTASLGTSTNRRLLDLLRKGSAFLGALSVRFAVENPQLHVLSFYELEKFSFLSCKVSSDSTRTRRRRA